MTELKPNWEMDGHSYPKYSFYAVDRRKLKKLKRKYYIVKVDNAAGKETVKWGSIKISNSTYYVLSESLMRYPLKVFLVKSMHVNNNWLSLSLTDDTRLDEPAYLFFNTKQEYLKWKLQNG